jgi:phosphatidylserine/phosphatidylglycerophosphate/cardiolipin synthase-like enzyme
VKLDSHHPTGSSHHQKLVCIDDSLAFCGGIDTTCDRWDTREHLPDNPGRKRPDGSLYGPWHDATSAMTGEAARAVGIECRERWQAATGKMPGPIDGIVHGMPAGFQVAFEHAEIALARTHPRMSGQPPVHEIEALFLDQIAAARQTIYLESQYFASRRIARAIALRLGEANGPEIVVINPQSADGWLEQVAMDSARARLVAALRELDRHGRFAVYHPVTAKGSQIYVHAKIAIFDDRILRIGSANLNNRSMRLDTECDVSIDAARHPGRGFDERIAALRNDLLAEHLGVTQAQFAEALRARGSLIAAIEDLRGDGQTLKTYEFPERNGITEWLAENEILDPEEPDELFEPIARRGLLHWRKPRS